MLPNALQDILDQLQRHIGDNELRGRLYADLHDVLEASLWFSSALEKLQGRQLTQDEFESFFIDLEVKLVQHLGFHLESLKRDLPTVLDALAEQDEA